MTDNAKNTELDHPAFHGPLKHGLAKQAGAKRFGGSVPASRLTNAFFTIFLLHACTSSPKVGKEQSKTSTVEKARSDNMAGTNAMGAPSSNSSHKAPTAISTSNSALVDPAYFSRDKACQEILDKSILSKALAVDLSLLEHSPVKKSPAEKSTNSSNCFLGNFGSPYRFEFHLETIQSSIQEAEAYWQRRYADAIASKGYLRLDDVGTKAVLQAGPNPRRARYRAYVLVANTIFSLRVEGSSLAGSSQKSATTDAARAIALQLDNIARGKK